MQIWKGENLLYILLQLYGLLDKDSFLIIKHKSSKNKWTATAILYTIYSIYFYIYCMSTSGSVLYVYRVMLLIVDQ